jgi:hypothetical protein
MKFLPHVSLKIGQHRGTLPTWTDTLWGCVKRFRKMDHYVGQNAFDSANVDPLAEQLHEPTSKMCER